MNELICLVFEYQVLEGRLKESSQDHQARERLQLLKTTLCAAPNERSRREFDRVHVSMTGMVAIAGQLVELVDLGARGARVRLPASSGALAGSSFHAGALTQLDLEVQPSGNRYHFRARVAWVKGATLGLSFVGIPSCEAHGEEQS